MELKQDNGRYCSIDLGINNLATIGSNVIKPVIINGKPLKSINQYYNKKLSEYKSKLDTINKQKTSKRIQRLTKKRNNKINDYLHKSSRYIINHLVSNHINTLIIGKNDGWKQEVNIGDRTNQNFVNIPHSKFIDIINYKCKLVGINTIVNEESYTSKCSFLDDEEICKHLTYCGNRIKRGLFKSKHNKLINADLNGSLNIMKKVVGKFNYNPIEVCSTPLILSF
jgi:putative transposase